jgi:hypothetical protein
MAMRMDLQISFKTSQHFLKNELLVVSESNNSGYITSPGYDGFHYTPPRVEASMTIVVPQSFTAVMISFARLQVDCASSPRFGSSLDVTGKRGNSSVKGVQRICPPVSAEVFQVEELTISYKVQSTLRQKVGFKMLFSFHPPSQRK